MSTRMSTSIDIGFRWIDDVSIELVGDRPTHNLQLKVSADVDKKYKIKSREKKIRQIITERIPCDKKEEVVIELLGCKHKYGFLKRKYRILSIKIPLANEELYTEATFQDKESGASLAITFAYTPGGDLRERVEDARRITEDQKVILDKIRHVHKFFEGLEVVCSTVEDLHPYIKIASKAILSIYRACERQKQCRDAALSLVEEMNELLIYGVEELPDVFRVNSDTKTAFKALAEAIREISECIEEQNKGMAGSLLRDAISASYKSKVEELRAKFKRAKEGLKDSMSAGTWKRVISFDLERKLKVVSSAYYRPGACCLPKTRILLLKEVDTWIERSCGEKIAWVYGYAGSGKSALFNSVAKNLENACIPFTCFSCKRDEPDRSDTQRILPTICYDFTQCYGDYRGIISNIFDQPVGRSISTGDVASQYELLFGDSPSYGLISPEGARRPPVHVILIDALDECKDVQQRSALAWFLRDLANSVPWIKVLITSRREPDIVDVLGSGPEVHLIDINSRDWKVDDDIRLFLGAELKRVKLDHLSDLEASLVERASGLFIWCTTLFRYVNDSGDRETVLRTVLDSSSSSNEPLAPIYDLYDHVIASAVPPGHPNDSKLLHRILGVVLVTASRRPVSIAAMSELLGERYEWVVTITRRLHAILYEDPSMSGAIRVCHPSVLDYLSIKFQKGLYSSSLPKIHALLFENCLRMLKHELRFNICGLEDSSCFNADLVDLPVRISNNISEALRYGSLFWFSHLEQSNAKESSENINAFLNSLRMLFWIEILSLLGVIDRGILILQDCARLFGDQASSGIPEMASEWEHFLLTYGDALQSTPHLYLSALSWIPESSRLRTIIADSFSELPMTVDVTKTWNIERWSVNVGMQVQSVAYSPDGRLFAAGCWDGSVRLWEARSGRKARENIKTESRIYAVTFSPDNRWLASGHKDGSVRLWDLCAETINGRVLVGHTKRVTSIVFSPDGKRLVSGSWDKSIKVWVVASGTAMEISSKGHDNCVSSVTFLPDNKRIMIASGSWDKTVHILDLEIGKQRGELLHHNVVFSVACSQNGKFIATGSADATRLFNAQTYEPVGDPMYGQASYVCFSGDCKYVASGSFDRSIRVWCVETRSLVCELRGHSDWVHSMDFSPDGNSLLSGSEDGTIKIWDLKTISSQQTSGQSIEVRCISYLHNSNIVASGSNDGDINLWDVYTGDPVGGSLKGHTDSVNALVVSSDDRWLASASSDESIRMWDIDSDTASVKYLLGHTGAVYSIAMSSDNDFVVSGSEDKTVRLWDVGRSELAMTLRGHEGGVRSVTFSIDGEWIISGSEDHTIRVWDTHTGEAVGQPLRSHSNWITAIAVSPDGRWFASGSYDATVRIWSMSTLSVVHVLEGHFSGINSITFSPDSRYLVSASSQVIVWDVELGEAVGDTIRAHAGWIDTVAFSPNGREIASGSHDGTIRITDVRVRTDQDSYNGADEDWSELSDEELRVRWNWDRAHLDESNGWVLDNKSLLLWVPPPYQHDTTGGTRLVIGAHDREKPEIDYRKLFRFNGTRWKSIYVPKK